MIVIPKNKNYYKFKHDKINEKFKGDLSYIGDICYKNIPVAVYHANNPRKDLGHKEYMLICAPSRSEGFVSGMEKEELEKHINHAAKFCQNCSELLISLHRHDYVTCTCGEVMIDGGKDYTRSSVKGLDGTYNVLTKEFIENKKDD
jgi:hypothetical protein